MGSQPEKINAGSQIIWKLSLWGLSIYDNTDDERVWAWGEFLDIPAKSKSPRISLQPHPDAKEEGKYILVFRGKLGNEEDTVAGKIVKVKICHR